MPLGLSDNLFQRVISALVLLPAVLWPIYMGGWWFTGLLIIGGILMALEWNKLTGLEAPLDAVLSAFAIAAGLAALAQGIIGNAMQLLVFLLCLAALGAGMVRFGIFKPRGWWLTGIAYVGMPVVALWAVRQNDPWLVLWIFLVVWATDVGGYFAGKGIGGPKLAPRISPKKTWAGLGGGMILSVLVTLVLHHWFAFGSDILALSVFAALLAVWAQVGDLLESGIKRAFGVKDSGGLIPGHGGLLDRVDGLVFVAPAVALLHYSPWVGL